jgi:hypothetical protein
MKHAFLLVSAVFLSACEATPPVHWVVGGASLEIPHARWVRGEGTVDITADGMVFVDGDHQLDIDRAGRVFDLDAEPVALLEPDGRLIGPDDAPLGVVGSMHASLPGRSTAWITVTENGEVITYDDDGQRSGMGVWVGGCGVSARTHQVCTLVTHLIAMKLRDRSSDSDGLASRGDGMGVRMR